MVGRVQHNWSLTSLSLHPHKQSSVETGYLGDRIIKSVNSMLNIFIAQASQILKIKLLTSEERNRETICKSESKHKATL